MKRSLYPKRKDGQSDMGRLRESGIPYIRFGRDHPPKQEASAGLFLSSFIRFHSYSIPPLFARILLS